MKGQTLRSLIYLIVFAIITVFLTYVLAVTITNGSVGKTTTYKAAFTDATGLLKGDDVRVAGVRVGQIKDVTKPILKSDKDKFAHYCAAATADNTTDRSTSVNSCVIVTFGLDSAIPLQSGAHAVLKYRNLVGQRYLDVEQVPGTSQVLPAKSVLPITQTSPALDLTELFKGFGPLIQAVDPEDTNQIAYEIVASLQGEGPTLEQLLANTGSLSTSIASQDAAIGSLITNLNGVLATVDSRDTELTNLIDQLQRLTTGLAGDRDQIAASLGNVDKLATSTTTLLASIRPYLPTDLTQLSGLTHTLATTTTVNDQGKTQNTLDEFLSRFPSKITTITRTATYGGYFNFYLCQLNLTLSDGAAPISLVNQNTKACAAS